MQVQRRSYGGDSSSLGGADAGISMKAEALEADLFEQSVQIRRGESWTD